MSDELPGEDGSVVGKCVDCNTFADAKILQRPSIPLRIQTIDVTSAVNSPQAPLRHMRASA